MGYVFFDPWQRHAPAIEWFATSATLIAAFALFLAGLTSLEDKRLVRGACAAILALAIGFLAYRPSGAIYFALGAALIPYTVAGSALLCAAAITGVVTIFAIEWWLLRPSSGTLFPLIMAAEIVLIGAATTFAARRARADKRRHVVSERDRIARDLHDILGQTLSSITLKAELARRLLRDDPDRAHDEISEVERISRQALDEVRDAIHGYHAGDIQSEFERVDSMLQAAGIGVERSCDNLEIEPAQERVLALVLREAATNVVRHAQAKACRLVLTQSDGAYRLEISDDGRGGQHAEGLGMRSIRARIEALGGTAAWRTDAGTQLAITLPIVTGEATS